MSKLQLSETSRVLHTALGLLTFTAEELASLCSAKDATVRTILFRSKDLIEEVAELPPDPSVRMPPGRRRKRFRLSEEGRERLSRELAELTTELRPRPEHADTAKRIDAALAGAESSVELAKDPEETDTVDWHARARSQMESARRLLEGLGDQAAREPFLRRISKIERQLAPAAASVPKARWIDRARDLLAPLFGPTNADPSTGSAVPLSEPAGTLEGVALPCLWLDATDGHVATWNSAVAQGLLQAHHVPVHVRVERVADDPPLRERLDRLMTELPSEIPVFVTMCSRVITGRQHSKWIMRGLQRAIEAAGVREGDAPSITVLDHDLPADSFWLDHRIPNLRYYPTVQPRLAYQLAERLNESNAPVRAVQLGADLVGSASARLQVLPSELAPRVLRGDHLTHGGAELGFAALELASKHLNPTQNRPTCLIGLNKGGYLLARMLWDRAQVRADYLVKCEYNPLDGRVFFDGLPKDPVSSFLIVDDVVRTGRTMSAVRDYLGRRFINTRVHALALAVIDRNREGVSISPDLDYCAWVSNEPNLKFPWSDITEPQPSPAEFLDNTCVSQVGGWISDLRDRA